MITAKGEIVRSVMLSPPLCLRLLLLLRLLPRLLRWRLVRLLRWRLVLRWRRVFRLRRSRILNTRHDETIYPGSTNRISLGGFKQFARFLNRFSLSIRVVPGSTP